ncbi:MAG: capsular exopolysaccharide biosynthesis protein [Acidimicrobiales bacterium]|nr:capsular exopolysaccharide biosynthesis protein [Acidimicrobiales bacterium]
MGAADPIKVVWGYRWWLAVFIIVVVGATYASTKRASPVYDATSLTEVLSGRQAGGDFVSPEELLHLTNIYSQQAKTRGVAELAATNLQGVSASFLQSHVDVSAAADLQIINITGKSGDPASAAAYANAYANGLNEYVDKQQGAQQNAGLQKIQARVSEIQAELTARKLTANDPNAAALYGELQQLQTQAATLRGRPVDSIRIIETALAPSTPSSPRPTRDAGLAGILAALLGSVAAYLRSRLTDRYASADEAATDLGLPLLGEIPRSPKHAEMADEALRALRTSVEFGMKATAGRVVLVTSAGPGSGKTFVAASLGRAFAAGAQHVMIIDADLRRPALHSRLNLSAEPGLGDLIADAPTSGATLPAKEVALPALVRRRGGELHVVTCGRRVADPAEALASPAMRDAITTVRAAYDVAIIDSPPLLAVVDPVVLCRYIDGVVLVVDGQRDRRRDTRRALQVLRAVDPPILGIVFNGSREANDRYVYYSSSSSRDRTALEAAP